MSSSQQFSEEKLPMMTRHAMAWEKADAIYSAMNVHEWGNGLSGTVRRPTMAKIVENEWVSNVRKCYDDSSRGKYSDVDAPFSEVADLFKRFKPDCRIEFNNDGTQVVHVSYGGKGYDVTLDANKVAFKF